jgi:hypothetical protein
VSGTEERIVIVGGGPAAGADREAVQTVRRIGDAERLRELGPPDRALVVGSEAAASLALRGVSVTMATLEELPQIDRLGREVAEWLGEIGPAGDRAARVRFDDGHQEVVDRVLLALGVERNDGLAVAGGLTAEDGIEVDAAMRTADPRVLAAGEVAFAFNASAGRRLRVEHRGEALNMGEVAGKTLAGAEASWDGAPGFWSTIGERTINYAGWGDGWDEARFEDGDEGAFACWYGRGELVGIATHLEDAAYERGRKLIEVRTPWS